MIVYMQPLGLSCLLAPRATLSFVCVLRTATGTRTRIAKQHALGLVLDPYVQLEGPPARWPDSQSREWHAICFSSLRELG